MPATPLASRTHWVFDMDGTLTLAAHDFPAIRRELDIPDDADILHHLDSLPVAERDAKHAWLFEHERELALASRPAAGAVDLVLGLHARGVRLGILTRNAKALAHITLRKLGIDDYFDPAAVLGRDEAPPKPDPGGLLWFGDYWAVAPSRLVMVGDSRLDMACGRAAGTTTVLVNAAKPLAAALTDHAFTDCQTLLTQLRTPSGRR